MKSRCRNVSIVPPGITRRQDDQSRYLECAIHGVLVAGFYVTNGNPRPGPKFDYKMQWLDRLLAHAA